MPSIKPPVKLPDVAMFSLQASYTWWRSSVKYLQIGLYVQYARLICALAIEKLSKMWRHHTYSIRIYTLIQSLFQSSSLLPCRPLTRLAVAFSLPSSSIIKVSKSSTISLSSPVSSEIEPMLACFANSDEKWK